MDKYADICFPCSNEPGCLVILFWGEAVLRISHLFLKRVSEKKLENIVERVSLY